MNVDKGINELITAFDKNAKNDKDIYLALVGMLDETNPISEKNLETAKIEQLKKLTEENLIDMVNNIHTTQNLSIDESYKIKKQELLNNNLPKYNKHKKVISNSSQKSFSELYDKYNKLASNRYALDFSREYGNWQKQTN